MKRFLVLSCSVAISALFFHACSSSDDSMIDAPLTRADAVSEKIVFQDDFNKVDSILIEINGVCVRREARPEQIFIRKL